MMCYTTRVIDAETSGTHLFNRWDVLHPINYMIFLNKHTPYVQKRVTS